MVAGGSCEKLLKWASDHSDQTSSRIEDPPKLKTTDGEENEVWTKNIQWWSRLTKMPKTRQAPHIIIYCLHNKELQQIAQEVSIIDAETDQGLQLVLQKMYRHFLPNTFIRKLETWKTSGIWENQTTKVGVHMWKAWENTELIWKVKKCEWMTRCIAMPCRKLPIFPPQWDWT